MRFASFGPKPEISVVVPCLQRRCGAAGDYAAPGRQSWKKSGGRSKSSTWMTVAGITLPES